MTFTDQQKKKFERFITLLGKDNTALFMHIFEMQEKFDEQNESLRAVVENINALKPKKGQDYMTDEEITNIIGEILSKIPPPKDPEKINEEEIIRKALVKMQTLLPQEKSKPEVEVDYEAIVANVLSRMPSPEEKILEVPQSLSTEDIKVHLLALAEMGGLPSKIIEGLDTLIARIDDIERIAKANAFNPTMGPSFADLERLRILISSSSSSSTGGFSIETPYGTIDSSNAVFTVLNTPKVVVLNGSMYFQNDGYTLSGLTITMLVVPETGSTLRSLY